MTYPASAPTPAKPKGAFVTGIVMMVLSFVVFVVCVTWGTIIITGAASDSPVFSAPGETTATLDAGDHALWTPTDGEYLFADDVTITGPGGEVSTRDHFADDTGTVTLTKGSRSYTPEVTFTAPTTGSYTVVVDEGASPTEVLVGPPTSVVTGAFVVIAVAFVVSFIIGTIGLILFIVGLVKRNRVKRQQQGPPAGGYGGYGGYGQPTPPGQPTYGQPGAYPQAGAPPPYGAPPGPPPVR